MEPSFMYSFNYLSSVDLGHWGHNSRTRSRDGALGTSTGCGAGTADTGIKDPGTDHRNF